MNFKHSPVGAKAWQAVKAMNETVGTNFFKVMVDAAHCGDSDLDIPQNEAVIQEISDGGALGIFHASAKTTRGCLSTDDGWIGALMSAYARTGNMKHVFVEIFHHEDPALEPLCNLDSGHGIDTSDGRSYSQMVVDGVVDVTCRLNNLVLGVSYPIKSIHNSHLRIRNMRHLMAIAATVVFIAMAKKHNGWKQQVLLIKKLFVKAP